MADPDPHVQELLDGLKAARDEFLAAIGDIDPALRTTPGLVGDWSARELLAHVGYWAGHAAESLHRAEQGELPSSAGTSCRSTSATRSWRASRPRPTTPRSPRARRAPSSSSRRGWPSVDPESLGERDADGDTLEEIIAFDGADHYREHTLDIRSWFDGADAADVEGRADEADAD